MIASSSPGAGARTLLVMTGLVAVLTACTPPPPPASPTAQTEAKPTAAAAPSPAAASPAPAAAVAGGCALACRRCRVAGRRGRLPGRIAEPARRRLAGRVARRGGTAGSDADPRPAARRRGLQRGRPHRRRPHPAGHADRRVPEREAAGLGPERPQDAARRHRQRPLARPRRRPGRVLGDHRSRPERPDRHRPGAAPDLPDPGVQPGHPEGPRRRWHDHDPGDRPDRRAVRQARGRPLQPGRQGRAPVRLPGRDAASVQRQRPGHRGARPPEERRVLGGRGVQPVDPEARPERQGRQAVRAAGPRIARRGLPDRRGAAGRLRQAEDQSRLRGAGAEPGREDALPRLAVAAA